MHRKKVSRPYISEKLVELISKNKLKTSKIKLYIK